MKVGELVKNLNSESRMTGVVVGWHIGIFKNRAPIVLWADGRCNWIVPSRVEVIDESRRFA
jgi:hypothetical protein